MLVVSLGKRAVKTKILMGIAIASIPAVWARFPECMKIMRYSKTWRAVS